MGLFTDTKQEELNNAAISIHSEFDTFTKILDQTGGIMIHKAIFHANQVENSILNFDKIAKKYHHSHRYVNWAGQMVLINALLTMILTILEDIEKATGHTFNQINKLK